MSGRASLIVILGFSVVIGAATRYWTWAGGQAVSNITAYYYSGIAHNGATAAANLACDSIFQNNGDSTMSLTGTFPLGGTYKIATQMQQGYGKFRNCLITATYSVQVRSDTTYIDTVQVLLTPYSFSRYAFYTTNDSGVNWTTGDTLTGPYQSNGSMNVTGVPVIKGPVSIGRQAYNSKTVGYPSVSWATWESNKDTLKCTSFRNGVTDSMPNSFDTLYTIGDTTKVFTNSSNADTSHAYDVYLTFDTTNGGSVTETDTTRVHSYVKTDSTYNSMTKKYTYTYAWIWSTVSSTTKTKISISSITNSKTGEGLILVNNGDAHVSGTVKGDITVVANQPTTNYRQSYTSTQTSNSYFDFQTPTPVGNILIDGALMYNNPTGSDMLGLVANNSVMLTNMVTSTVTIDAAIFALKGSFTYENYTTGSSLGYINLLGSISQYKRGPVGLVGGTGFLKNYKYDPRYRYISPPGFPLSHHYCVLSWRE
jgi:hypothetical protein